MTQEFELEMSPLSQPITVDGKTVQVDIYRAPSLTVCRNVHTLYL